MMRGTVQHLLFAVAALATVMVAACGGDDESATPTPTPTATQTASPTNPATATPTPSIEDEVAAAYLAYWDAYSDAVLNLDASFVEGLSAGEDLDSIKADIEMLRADGVAARIDVDHDFLVVEASETSATVIDQVVNNSVLVDPVTKEPIDGEGTGETLRYTFFFENIDGRWVVVRATREAVE
ncbi:MAG: hypothetical protein R3C39_10990 [Dehalococcoidia bacterium]